MDRSNDRISEYLVPHLKDYLFDELSDSYLEKAGILDIMKGVEVPIHAQDMKGMTVLKIAKNMAFVMGCDPSFRYVDNYIAYILRNFDIRFSDALLSEGLDAADKRDYDYACIMFRASMLINPDNANAYYCYGRACKDAYELGEEEEYIGRFKAESLEAFEIATIKDPKLVDAFYFLGYAYVNMGLYIKTKLTWEEYVKLVEEKLAEPGIDALRRADAENTLKEIRERLETLEIPCKIEEGYNLILSGRYEEGIKALEIYKGSRYKDWWPLYFYLGVAYMSIAEDHENETGAVDEIALTAYEEAIKNYLEVLKYSPSNEDAITKLAVLYRKTGDTEKANKFENKLEVVKNNQELDRQLAEENRKIEKGIKLN
ncbi:MAG: tetratricopeptide repeat protein [Clostridia bacterium]|nr:tetratricopeptide repeat protein [Clostridia bacterium]